MNKFSLIARLTITNIKRLKSYIPTILIAVIILLTVCSLAGNAISKNVYSEQQLTTIGLAYYLPADNDEDYLKLSVGMLENMDSMGSTINMMKVDTIDEGYELLDRGEVLYFVIVPENFITGIMMGDNYPLEIVVRDNSNLISYIANELFLAYAGYLGIAEAAVYSAMDVAATHGYDPDQINALQYNINFIYLNRALDKDVYIDKVTATGEGNFSLTQHYISVAIMISLFLLGLILIPMHQSYCDGIKLSLAAKGINSLHIFICNFVASCLALYIAFIPCMINVTFYSHKLALKSLFMIIPAIIAIALIICLISSISKQVFSGNMSILVITILIAYIGGGILPGAMLPRIVQEISPYLPGEYIIRCICNAMF